MCEGIRRGGGGRDQAAAPAAVPAPDVAVSDLSAQPDETVDSRIWPGEQVDTSDLALGLRSGPGESATSMAAAALATALAGIDPASLPSDSDALELVAA